jgi:hypothetical protein
MFLDIWSTAYSSVWPKNRVQEELVRDETETVRRQIMEDSFDILGTLAKERYKIILTLERGIINTKETIIGFISHS